MNVSFEFAKGIGFCARGVGYVFMIQVSVIFVIG